jgi:hypothetical protein
VFWCPVSKAYYDRKRKEGKGHKQAVLVLARRRVNVLWAMIRDKAPFQAAPPHTAHLDQGPPHHGRFLSKPRDGYRSSGARSGACAYTSGQVSVHKV